MITQTDLTEVGNQIKLFQDMLSVDQKAFSSETAHMYQK